MDDRIRTASPQDIDVVEVDVKPDVGTDKISAYYSLIFPNFTYYLQTLSVTIGRRCIPSACASSSDAPQVDVDLGPLKSVSRLHAKIEYEEEEEHFVLVVIGRNGAWVDGVWSGSGSRVALSERSQIQIASRTFHFVLPPPPVPEDTPSPSSQSSTNRLRSPSLDVTSIDVTSMSPPSSLPSHSPPPATLPPDLPKIPPLIHEPKLPNSNTIGKSKANTKKRKKSDASEPLPPKPKPEDMPPKPTLTYAHLIYRAIKALNGKATLQEITQWIMETFDYYKWCDKAWMSSVRHNLSSSRAFKKMERCGGDRGKGFFWSLDEEFQHTFEEQENKGQSSAPASGGKEGPVKGRKKDKGASLLEPPLKRSVKGDLKGAPLPPPLTTTPLAFKTSTVTSSTATTSQPTPTAILAYPQTQHPITLNPPYGSTTNSNAPSTVKSEYSATPLSAPNSYASNPTQAHSPYAPPPASTPLSTTTKSATPTSTQSSATAPAPQTTSSLAALPSSVHVPIIVGPLPPSHPSHSSSSSNPTPAQQHFPTPPIVLHDNALILNPDIFSHLTAQQLKELEALGAQKALEILQGYIVRFLKEKMRGPVDGRGGRKGRKVKRGRGGAVTVGGTRGGSAVGGNGSTEAAATKIVGASQETADGMQGVQNQSRVPADVEVKPPVPVPVGQPGTEISAEDAGSPIVIVDDSEDEGPAVKRRRVDQRASATPVVLPKTGVGMIAF